MTRFAKTAALAAAVMAAVAACTSGSAPAHVATATRSGGGPSTTAPQGITQLVHTAAQCVRDHGVPNFPDPVLDTHGRLQVDDALLRALSPAAMQQIEAACKPQIDAAQAAADATRPPVTPQELAQETKFSQCMRQHGWPNFPDPDPHGGFQLNHPGDGPNSKADPSFQACRQFFPPKGK